MVCKRCVVPQCTNTSVTSPQKVFIPVPTNPKRRIKWLQLARRDPYSIAVHASVFMCEDHFDVEKDVTSYMKYKMGFCQKLILTAEAVPSKFHCQKNSIKRLCESGTYRALFSKRQRRDIIKEHSTETVQNEENILQKTLDEGDKIEDLEPESLPRTLDKGTITDLIITEDKCVQAAYRSKSAETKLSQKTRPTSPLKKMVMSQDTSPFKIKPCHAQPSKAGSSRLVKKNIFPMNDLSIKLIISSVTLYELDEEEIENFLKIVKINNAMQTYECKICNKIFLESSNMDTQSNKNTYKCNICTKDVKHLKAHLLKNSEKQTYKCNICNKKFSILGLLKSHFLLKHSGLRPYFSYSSNFRSHVIVLTHSGEKP